MYQPYISSDNIDTKLSLQDNHKLAHQSRTMEHEEKEKLYNTINQYGTLKLNMDYQTYYDVIGNDSMDSSGLFASGTFRKDILGMTNDLPKEAILVKDSINHQNIDMNTLKMNAENPFYHTSANANDNNKPLVYDNTKGGYDHLYYHNIHEEGIKSDRLSHGSNANTLYSNSIPKSQESPGSQYDPVILANQDSRPLTNTNNHIYLTSTHYEPLAYNTDNIIGHSTSSYDNKPQPQSYTYQYTNPTYYETVQKNNEYESYVPSNPILAYNHYTLPNHEGNNNDSINGVYNAYHSQSQPQKQMDNNNNNTSLNGENMNLRDIIAANNTNLSYNSPNLQYYANEPKIIPENKLIVNNGNYETVSYISTVPQHSNDVNFMDDPNKPVVINYIPATIQNQVPQPNNLSPENIIEVEAQQETKRILNANSNASNRQIKNKERSQNEKSKRIQHTIQSQYSRNNQSGSLNFDSKQNQLITIQQSQQQQQNQKASQPGMQKNSIDQSQQKPSQQQAQITKQNQTNLQSNTQSQGISIQKIEPFNIKPTILLGQENAHSYLVSKSNTDVRYYCGELENDDDTILTMNWNERKLLELADDDDSVDDVKKNSDLLKSKNEGNEEKSKKSASILNHKPNIIDKILPEEDSVISLRGKRIDAIKPVLPIPNNLEKFFDNADDSGEFNFKNDATELNNIQNEEPNAEEHYTFLTFHDRK